MRYHSAHAARSGSVPFALRGPKSLRTVLSAAVAGIIGLTPAVMISSPASAATASDVTFGSSLSVTAVEGTVAELTLTWIGAGVPDADLVWKTTAGSATAGTDFVGVAGQTVVFDATTKTARLRVTTSPDTVDEPSPEDLTVTVADPDLPNAAIATATVNVEDDDNPPGYTFTADATTITEAAANVTVTATLLAASDRQITIPYYTANGTARGGAGLDFTPTSGTLTFTPGDTSETFTVPVLADTVWEGDQDFTINAAAGTNVTGTATPITVTIADDETRPTVAIGTISAATEGAPLTVPVTTTGASESDIVVRYATADVATPTVGRGAAVAGTDYTAATGQVTFPGGTSSTQNITIATAQDTLDELAEELRVTLSEATNATLSNTDATKVAVINDTPDTPPAVSVAANTNLTEGNTGTTTQNITIRLSAPSGRTQVVDYTVGGVGTTATADTDFRNVAAGSLTFLPGEVTKTIPIEIIGDTTDETDEIIKVTLTAATAGAGTVTNTGSPFSVTITDDDAAPTASVANVTIPEGEGPSAALVTVKLSNAATVETTYNLAFTDITADSNGTGAGADANPAGVGENDYLPITTGTDAVRIPAGSTSGYAFVLINGDAIYEDRETATVSVTPNTGASSLASQTAMTATLTLTNEDAAPVLSIRSEEVAEGETATVNGYVTGVSQTAASVNVTFAGGSVSGSRAASADDFTNPGATAVSIPGGTASGTSFDLGNVRITDDAVEEPAETIVVSGTPFGTSATVSNGAITISASDAPTPGEGPGEGPGEEPGEGPGEEPGEEPATPVAPTILSIPASVAVGRNVTINGSAGHNETVELWRAPATTGPAVRVAVKEAVDNDFQFIVPVTQGYRFQIRAAAGVTAPYLVRVVPALTLAAASRATGAVTVTATGNPRFAGMTMIVQRNVNGQWVQVARGVTNASGVYSATVTRLPSRSAQQFRVVSLANTVMGLLPGTSATVRTTVR